MSVNISVIIPVFNTIKYLRECLDSVVGQQGVNFEVICIDDESTDGSYELLTEYQKHFPEMIHVFRMNHGGISRTRNYGFQIATGKYLYYMDSDDVLKPNALAHMFHYCEKYVLDLFFFSFENFADDIVMANKYQKMIQNKQKRHKQRIEVVSGHEQFIKFINEKEYYVTVWCQCIRKEYALASGLQFPEVMYFEDQIYTYQALEKAHFVACSSEVLYFKRIRPNSVCTTQDKTNYIKGNMETIFFLENILAEIGEKMDSSYCDATRKLLNDSKLKLYNLLNKFSGDEYTKYLQIMYDTIEKGYEKKDNAPLVSICIPTSGVEKWILPVLDSIFTQKLSKELFEVVITNNGPRNELLDQEIEKMKCLYGNIRYEYNSSDMFVNEIEAYKLARGKMIKFVNHRTLLRCNALKSYLVTSFYLFGIKPVIYFSNGVLNKNEVMQFRSFDEFIMRLGYWSSWSGGMCCWKDEFDQYKDAEVYNKWFPHTNILFKNHSSNIYFINDIVYLDEMPVGKIGKGKYDVFNAFAVEFPKIFLDMEKRGTISEDLFHYIKNEILQFIAFMYYGYVMHSKATSYDLSGYSVAISQYYRHEEVMKVINEKYNTKLQEYRQCRVLVIEYAELPVKSVYDWVDYREILGADNHVIDDLREKLVLEYKFVRVDIIGISSMELCALDKQIQMRRIEAYLDEDVNYILIRYYGLKHSDIAMIQNSIDELSPNAVIYETID